MDFPGAFLNGGRGRLVTTSTSTSSSRQPPRALVTSPAAAGEVCYSQACLRAASRLLDNMDRSVDPCDNFYQYTCGQFVADHIVPEDSHYRSAMQQMQEDVLVIIRKMLTADKEENETEAMGKAKRLYHSCMNTSFTVHQQDMADSPIFEILTEKKLGLWPILDDRWSEDMYDLENLLGHLTVYQVNTFFDSYITPDERNSSVYSLQFYKGSPALSRSYFLNSSNEEYRSYMKTYRALLSETLVALLPGDNKPNETHIDDLLEFETRFANMSVLRACDAGAANLTDEELQQAEDENNPRLSVAELELKFPQASRSIIFNFDEGLTPDIIKILAPLQRFLCSNRVILD
ncbi:Peptidase M13 N-terminal domain [Trinorchestia longiramus]|nr:Peptidase M13 N-terminal domain [Trinorchestia longiramus]